MSIDYFTPYLPALTAVVLVTLVLWGANWFLVRNKEGLGAGAKLPRQLLMLVITVIACLSVLLLIPMSEATRGQVLKLLGLVLTGVVAFSSTTFVANAMAGLMLRIVRSFRSGDFITVGGYFGRVSERGLFHTEIQTEERDLTTLPNLHLVSNPVTVIRSSGTVISAMVSLGYDLNHSRIEELLVQAATQTGLREPFVQVKDLQDYTVSYRIAGFLAEVKQLLTVRSNLRRNILDVLHGNGIEIASPAIMIQRRLEEGKKIIPESPADGVPVVPEETEAPEEIIFDKAEEAEEAEKVESLNDEQARISQKLSELEGRKESLGGEERQKMEKEIAVIHERLAQLVRQVDAARDNADREETRS